MEIECCYINCDVRLLSSSRMRGSSFSSYSLDSLSPLPTLRFREDKFCEDKFREDKSRGNDPFTFTHSSQIKEFFNYAKVAKL